MENLRLEPHQVRKARKEITETKHEDTVSEKEEVNHMLNSSQTIIEWAETDMSEHLILLLIYFALKYYILIFG